MAAVTVTSGGANPHVLGDRREVTAVVTAANTGDTWTPPGFSVLTNVIATPPSSTAVTPNFSTAVPPVITFNYSGGGSMVGITVTAIGI